MSVITQKNILNIVPGMSAPLVVHVSQGDSGVELVFTLVDGDEIFDPTGTVISVHGIRQDGNGWGPVACARENGMIKFTLPDAATAVKGSGMAEVVISNESETVGTTNFAILVETATFPQGVTYANDVSVYEAILAYVQNMSEQTVANVEADLAAEIANRQAADAVLQQNINSEASARSSADTTLQGNINAEATARANAISSLNEALTSETSARTNADSAEVTARSTADALLQSQIDQLVSPSGEAPSAAEVENARITWYGKTESTLGNAIRKQTSDIADAISKSNIIDKGVFVATSNYAHVFKFFPVKAGNILKFSTDSTAKAGISTRQGDGTVIQSFSPIDANSSSIVTITTDADFIDAYATVAGTVTVEVMNGFKSDIEKNTNEISVIENEVNDIVDSINLLDEAVMIDGYRVNPTTGAIESGYGTWKVYAIDVTPGKMYHVTRTSDVIAMIWYYDSNDDPINSLYNLGLDNWNEDFTVPSGAVKLRATVTPDYILTAFIGENYNKWESGKRYTIGEKILIPSNDNFVTIGNNGDFATLVDGFAYANANDLGVVILPGTYDLVTEGVNGYGLVCPKHVKGYGAKIVLNLSNEDWDISALNMPTDKSECIIEGVDIEVTNGRYCIHDEMYNYSGAYHHVIKNCRLKHNSAISEVLLSPRAIGGGIGNAGVVEIYNCYADSQVTYGDIAYHSNALGSQTDNVYIHVHDNDIAHAIQFSKSGNDDSYCNIAYVSNNRFGLHLPTEGTFTNIKTIAWNNVLSS